MNEYVRYFISYEAAVVVTVDDCREVRTFKNNTEMAYPVISSYNDIEIIEEQLSSQISAMYESEKVPAEILYVTILNYIRFEIEHNTVQ